MSVSKESGEMTRFFENAEASCCTQLKKAISCGECNVKVYLTCVGLNHQSMEKTVSYKCRNCKKGNVRQVQGKERSDDRTSQLSSDVNKDQVQSDNATVDKESYASNVMNYLKLLRKR